MKSLLAQRGGTSDDADGSASGAAAVQEIATLHWLNRTIGGITIRRLIGAGGMGSVFEGVQQSPRRTVAVKILRDAIPSKRALRRFEYEAQTLARMEHPGITKVHAIDVADEHGIKIPYFVMELSKL
ncbi:MAG: protein kinase [Phycisphaerales bacterium]|nr:protein kinase [Phycisphaerales bacterium]